MIALWIVWGMLAWAITLLVRWHPWKCLLVDFLALCVLKAYSRCDPELLLCKVLFFGL